MSPTSAAAFASRIIDAPVEAVWAVVRDFSALPHWVDGLGPCVMEDGRPGDSVGGIRAFTLGDGTPVREKLLALDDARYRFSYDFQTPAFPVSDYVARFELIPVISGERTYAQWSADFIERPEDVGKYRDIVANVVFGAGLESLARKVAANSDANPPHVTPRWQGLRPAKVFCSSVIRAPLPQVWARVRDFAGMGDWHEDVRNMHMADGARSDQVGAVRDFSMNGGHLLERLTYLSDAEHALRYTIDESAIPWLNYHAGVELRPVTADDTTLGIWTADWVADAQDDVRLIPDIHANVFQKAFDTLDHQATTCGSAAAPR